MIPVTYLTGDATQPRGTGPRIIVHVCNDVGAWGSGFVLAVSNRWREPEKDYRSQLAHTLGHVRFIPVEDRLTVANLIGQHGIRWMGDVPPIRYDAIESGLSLVAIAALGTDATVHMPRIGCSLAGGTWDRVEPLIVNTLCARDVATYVYDLPGSSNAASRVTDSMVAARQSQ